MRLTLPESDPTQAAAPFVTITLQITQQHVFEKRLYVGAPDHHHRGLPAIQEIEARQGLLVSAAPATQANATWSVVADQTKADLCDPEMVHFDI